MKKGIRNNHKYLSLPISTSGTSFINLSKINNELIHEIHLFDTLSPYSFSFTLYLSNLVNNTSISYQGGNISQIGNDILSYKGRKLIGYINSNTNLNITYEYYYNGLRKKKTIGNIIHNYYYRDCLLVKEVYNGNVIDFIYGTNNRYIGFKYNGTVYYYLYNAIGNIDKIIDNNGIEQASYIYTSYGKIANEDSLTTIGIINPIRYKGYYYDSDTGLYYLESRYYNPTWGRFISSDDFDYLDSNSLIGLNLFAYCNNNPVMYSDESRTIAISTMVLALGVGFIIGASVDGIRSNVSQKLSNDNVELNWKQVGLDAFFGGSGLVSCSGICVAC